MSATLDTITSLLRDKFKVKGALGPDVELKELSLDSLDVINFLFSTEQATGVKIPDEAINSDQLKTLADMARYIDSRR